MKGKQIQILEFCWLFFHRQAQSVGHSFLRTEDNLRRSSNIRACHHPRGKASRSHAVPTDKTALSGSMGSGVHLPRAGGSQREASTGHHQPRKVMGRPPRVQLNTNSFGSHTETKEQTCGRITPMTDEVPVRSRTSSPENDQAETLQTATASYNTARRMRLPLVPDTS